jgi:Ran-binding protein 1
MAGDDEKDVREVEEATSSGAPAEGSDEVSKAGEEEDTGAQVAPIVTLQEVAVSTGEENEDVLIDMKAKLYRFDKEGTQWKERGVGQVKILEHKTTGKVRLLMRQNRTLKICANHMVSSSTQLQEHAGSDKTWVWHARDYSDGELKEELFCMRFGSVESAQKFKNVYEAAQEKVSSKTEEKDEEADETADLLDKLKVDSKAEKADAPEEAKTEN